MRKSKHIFEHLFLQILILLLFSFSLQGQEYLKINPSLLAGKWNAQWITYPEGSLKEYGVFHFRRTFEIQNQTDEFIIHVSGDNRYRLFVNGTEVCKGPARGDLANWRFETVDISEYLKTGENVLSAVVWNFGDFMPLAQVSNKTAFIVQANSSIEGAVNTGINWKIYKNEAYTPPTKASSRTVVGVGNEVDGSCYPYGWELIDFDDDEWRTPKILGNGIPNGKFTFWDWNLVPRNIPFMEYKFQRLEEMERSENIQIDKSFLEGKSPLTIAPNKKVKILFDQTFLTTAYPEILVSGGKGSTIEISYAEALVDKNGTKGNRNLIEGKTMLTYYSDKFMPDGGEDRRFQPLWFRTYRYLELAVETRDEPLIIEDLYGYFTAYPFEEKAYFRSSDPALQAIWDVGWRTARLCAGETYFDCPYYEQLQYVGDTRIQALISLYVANDDKLMRNAIDQFHNSLLPIGLTQSRFPCSEPQVIPTFSLIWIEMIHDYWMHRDDPVFVKKYLNGIRNVLYWYGQQINDKGMLGAMDWWNFVDWSFGPWDSQKPVGGTPPGAIEGNSSIITLQYAHALQVASELFEAFGDQHQALEYRQLSQSVMSSTYKLCWSNEKGLLADTPEKFSYSQHANVLAILTGMFEDQESADIFGRILTDEDLIQTTLYFKFYLIQAMKEAGLADTYLSMLEPWKEMIDMGLTTFAETPEPTRSDCHAWSASPNYHFLSVVSGIEPASPGFKTVKIEPHPGPLNYLECKIMHPRGEILMELKRRGKEGITGEIIIPEGLPGKFAWRGQEIILNSGSNKINL
ncbi:MAG: alpha-L-rhamnosidase [Bacteroidales bacterium]|nr:alpha-L-rhamnosidase [Bacteroidales bacterium]